MLNLINTFINSPLDQFESQLFFSIFTPFIDINNFNITTFALYTFIVLFIIISLFMFTNNNNIIIGSKWFITQEIIYDTIVNTIKNQIGGKLWGFYMPFIYTFFIFILVSNLVSIIPYSFALTAQFVFIISLSFIVWLGITIIGFYKHGLVFFALFVPQGTPLVLVPLLVLIEIMSYIIRSLSLGLRLAANVIAGHLLIIILGGLLIQFISINILLTILGFIPLLIILCVVMLEFAIAIIQSYVWLVLIASYMKDVQYLH